MSGGNWCRWRSVVDYHRRSQMGPLPEPGAVGVVQAKAAVAASIAPHAAPVVVVQAGAVAGEVLGEQDVGQVVPAWTKGGNANRVAVHRFVGHAAQDRKDASRGRPRSRAFDGQE